MSSPAERAAARERGALTGAAPTVSALDGRRLELLIGGMSCAACAARVQKTLNKIDGVSASVNFATEKATVEVPTDLEVDQLIAQVQKAGYHAAPIATPVAGDNPAEPEEFDDARVAYLWRRLIVAALCYAPLGDLSIALVLAPSLRFSGWQWVLLSLTLPVAIWCAWPFHRNALVNARHGATSMDTLISVGIVTASGWSVYTMFFTAADERADGVWGLIFRPSGSIYLDVVATVTTFVLAGRLFEARAKRRAGGALRALAAVGAKDVVVLDADDVERRLPVAQLAVGNRFVARPGETLAADGQVISGRCAVDTSAMTGESAPVEVGPGDPVVGGTVNLSGRLLVRATGVGADTQLAALVRLVERAQTDKAGVQRLADRICAVFVPAVFAFAALAFGGWMLLDGSIERAVAAGLAVLIIACPCALGLATPTALLVASGRGAQLGVFIKGHQALESAKAVDTVVLDKTGTVTTGRMAVVGIAVAAGADRAAVLRAAGAVEDASEHATAAAITALARREAGPLPSVEGFIALPGRGAAGTVDGREVLVGSTRLISERGLGIPHDLEAARVAWEQAGRTSVVVAVDGAVRGVLGLGDTVKDSAPSAVAELKGLGLRTVLLTGDNAATARAVGAQIGVDEVIAEVLPDAKAAVIERLQAAGGSVAMVGDGVNDAPALARADLGLAVITGTDVAFGAADVILVRDDLRAIGCAIELARAALGTIRGNLTWAFGYNIAALPLAACGLLNPLIAGAAMALSSLFVVSNSLRLRRFRAGHEPQPAPQEAADDQREPAPAALAAR